MRSDEFPWLSPPQRLEADAASVHVWLAALSLPAASLQQVEALLSHDEYLHAHRFRLERDRCHYMAARGILRTLLGRYLQVAPASLHFVAGPYGKPMLAPDSGSDLLRFNLSHSHGLAVYVVAWDREVGIDIEYMRPLADLESLAQRFFEPQEQDALRSLPAGIRQQAFYQCWTRKEAYSKARGVGLSSPLDQFSVSLVPDEPARLLSVQGEPDEVRRWSLQALQPPDGYAAALAVEGAEWELACWQWNVAL